MIGQPGREESRYISDKLRIQIQTLSVSHCVSQAGVGGTRQSAAGVSDTTLSISRQC